MNRQQRRKAGIKEKAKIYNINSDQLEMIKRKATDDAVDRMVIIQLYVSLMVLRDYEGWGKIRLERFADRCMDMLDSINKDYLDYNDMIQVIEEETGYKIKVSI